MINMHSCLSQVPIFQGLSADDYQKIHQYIRPRQFKKGELVQLANQYTSELLVLNRGRAKVYRTTSSGNEQIIRLIKPGDFIGETAIFTDDPVQHDIVATEDSVFCSLGKDDFNGLIREYPDMTSRLLADMAHRLHVAEDQLESLGQQSAEERLITALKQYSGNKTAFRLPISKQDLASQIGVRPETLSRQLKQLQDDNVITVHGRSITWQQDL